MSSLARLRIEDRLIPRGCAYAYTLLLSRIPSSYQSPMTKLWPIVPTGEYQVPDLEKSVEPNSIEKCLLDTRKSSSC